MNNAQIAEFEYDLIEDINGDRKDLVSHKPTPEEFMGLIAFGWSKYDNRWYDIYDKNLTILKVLKKYPDMAKDKEVFELLIRNYHDYELYPYNYIPGQFKDYQGQNKINVNDDNYLFYTNDQFTGQPKSTTQVFQSAEEQEAQDIKFTILRRATLLQDQIDENDFTRILTAGIVRSDILFPKDQVMWAVSKRIINLLKQIAERDNIQEIVKSSHDKTKDMILDYGFKFIKGLDLDPVENEQKLSVTTQKSEPQKSEPKRTRSYTPRKPKKPVSLSTAISKLEENKQLSVAQIEPYQKVNPEWQTRINAADSETFKHYPRQFNHVVNSRLDTKTYEEVSEPILSVELAKRDLKIEPWATSSGNLFSQNSYLLLGMGNEISDHELVKAQVQASVWSFRKKQIKPN